MLKGKEDSKVVSALRSLLKAREELLVDVEPYNSDNFLVLFRLQQADKGNDGVVSVGKQKRYLSALLESTTSTKDFVEHLPEGTKFVDGEPVLQALQRTGLLIKNLPLHSKEEQKRIKSKLWAKRVNLPEDEIQAVFAWKLGALAFFILTPFVQYFGDKLGFFFAFLGMFGSWSFASMLLLTTFVRTFPEISLCDGCGMPHIWKLPSRSVIRFYTMSIRTRGSGCDHGTCKTHVWFGQRCILQARFGVQERQLRWFWIHSVDFVQFVENRPTKSAEPHKKELIEVSHTFYLW